MLTEKEESVQSVSKLAVHRREDNVLPGWEVQGGESGEYLNKDVCF